MTSLNLKQNRYVPSCKGTWYMAKPRVFVNWTNYGEEYVDGDQHVRVTLDPPMINRSIDLFLHLQGCGYILEGIAVNDDLVWKKGRDADRLPSDIVETIIAMTMMGMI